MLWDDIYSFFIKYIFGGYYAETEYSGYIGTWFYGDDFSIVEAGTYNVGVSSPFIFMDDSGVYPLNVPLGNYLSLIATIVSMIVIVFIACLFIKKIYNICAHVIG